MNSAACTGVAMRCDEQAEPRGACWLRSMKLSQCVGGESYASRVAEYDQFVASPPVLDPKDTKQIAKDLQRTFHNEPFATPEFIARLDRLLTAVAHHHSDGYLQSMNFVTAMVMQQILEDAPATTESELYWFTMVNA